MPTLSLQRTGTDDQEFVSTVERLSTAEVLRWLTIDYLKDLALYLDRLPSEVLDAFVQTTHPVWRMLWHVARLFDGGAAICLHPINDEPINLAALAQEQLWYTLGYAEKYGYDLHGHGTGLGMMTGYTADEVAEIPCMSWGDLREYLDNSAHAFIESLSSLPHLAVPVVGFPPYPRVKLAIESIFIIIEDTLKHFGQLEAALSQAAEQRGCVKFHRFCLKMAFDPRASSV